MEIPTLAASPPERRVPDGGRWDPCLIDKDSENDKCKDKDNFKMAASGYLFLLAFLIKTKIIITTAQTKIASKEKSPIW